MCPPTRQSQHTQTDMHSEFYWFNLFVTIYPWYMLNAISVTTAILFAINSVRGFGVDIKGSVPYTKYYTTS